MNKILSNGFIKLKGKKSYITIVWTKYRKL